jgi:hypothetical protein
MNSISTKRRNYWRTDVVEIPSNRIVGRLVSTPYGYRLHSTDTRLRWFRTRFFRTPAHLLNAFNTPLRKTL